MWSIIIALLLYNLEKVTLSLILLSLSLAERLPHFVTSMCVCHVFARACVCVCAGAWTVNHTPISTPCPTPNLSFQVGPGCGIVRAHLL